MGALDYQTLPVTLGKYDQVTDTDTVKCKFFIAGVANNVVKIDDNGFCVGSATYASAPFRVDYNGNVTMTAATITNPSISGANITSFGSSTAIDILGWTYDAAFTADSNVQVSWFGGTLTLGNGTTFSIVAGNTGTMSAVTYVYFDKNVSTTVLQKTTTASTAVGANKILLAVCKNVETGKSAQFQTMSGVSCVKDLITANTIAAATITGNEIAANTITSNKISVSQLSAISADMGSLTAGTITGAVIQTATTGYRIKMNYSTNKIEFLNGSSVLGEAYTDSGGDVILNAVDDVNFAIGGTIKAYIATGAFKPNSDGVYNLGEDNFAWNDVKAVRYNIKDSSPNQGITQNIEYKNHSGTNKVATFKGGILVDIASA